METTSHHSLGQRRKLIGLLRHALYLAESPQCTAMSVPIGFQDNEYSFDLTNLADRHQLIGELRSALHDLETPDNDCVEFELLGHGFCYEF